MPGGTRHYDFAKELGKRGCIVTIFASGFHYNQHKELKLAKNEAWRVEDVDGVRFVWIRTFPHQKNDWRRIVNMLSFMMRAYGAGKKITRKSKEKPDVIIGSAVHLFAVFAAYRLAIHYRAKFIMEVRDLWPQTLIDMGVLKETSISTRILRRLEKFLCKKAQKIIILSPLSKEYLASLGIDENKITLIPHGVDMSNYPPAHPHEERKRKFTIMYTGSLGVVNALMPVLAAADTLQKKGLKNIRIIFVGDGVEKNTLIRKSKTLHLANTEFRNAVAKIEIPSLLEEADVLLLVEHSILYGSSNKLFDYMASGKPIIFSTPAEHNRMSGVGCGISVPPSDSAALTQTIRTLYQMSPRERQKMGKKGRIYVEQHHAIPLLVDLLEKTICEEPTAK